MAVIACKGQSFFGEAAVSIAVIRWELPLPVAPRGLQRHGNFRSKNEDDRRLHIGSICLKPHYAMILEETG
jgi:hypothetical protein